MANGGTIKCGGHCKNVNLQMGDYQLKTHMFAIDMGGCELFWELLGYACLGQSAWTLNIYT